MGLFDRQKTAKQLRSAYSNGFQGCPLDPADHELMLQEGLVGMCGDTASEPIKDLHKERPRSLLFKPLRLLDPPTGGRNQGGLASESQTTGDCTSHGTRNCIDGTRAVEIVVDNQPEQWVARGATEYIYSGRGHGGAGMSPQRATRIVSEGQLLRLDYSQDGGPNLTKYNARLGMDNGRRGIPKSWADIARNELKSHKFYTPRSVEDALDCMAAGFCGHAGSQFGSRSNTGNDGLNHKTESWNHDMAHFGYDLTREIWKVEVAFVPNSWGAWNKPNKVWLANEEVLGPWIPGMLVVPIEEFERHIINARSTYYHAQVEGDRIAPIPLTTGGSVHWGVAA